MSRKTTPAVEAMDLEDAGNNLGHEKRTIRSLKKPEPKSSAARWIEPKIAKMTDSPRSISARATPGGSRTTGSKIPTPTALKLFTTMQGSVSKITQLQKLQAAAKLDFNQKEVVRKTKATKIKGFSWVERNFPTNVDELFVHKKKVEEVQSWLKSTMGIVDHPETSRRVSKICLLSGPTGSGKTATLFLAAKELNLEIKEWIQPMSLTDFNPNRLSKYDPDEVQGKSQFDVFSDFLFRASQYSTIPIKGRTQLKHKIVVVEDFPNIFYRNADLFHSSILRPYNGRGVFPVVFIIPDCASREINAYNLFPKSIIQELNISCISLNAVAATFMVKFMSIVCSKEGVQVDKSVLESIAAASGGDIRCAINTLQFKLSEGDAPVVFKTPALKKTSKSSKAVRPNSDIQKDETLFLFRALGKVLYSKRKASENVESRNNNVPENATKYLRNNPLEEDVEQLVDKIEVPADTFLNFLQQNYLPFFGSMDDIVSASSHMADAEFMLSRWPFDDSGTASRTFKEREAREEIALLVASRGIMYSNVHKAKSEWRPLKKPMLTDVRTQIQTRLETTRFLFPSDGPIQMNFFSEVLPLYNKLLRLRSSNWMPNQKSFITEMGSLNTKSRSKHQKFHDTLREKDAAEESDSEELQSAADDGGIKLPAEELPQGKVTSELVQKVVDPPPKTLIESDEEYVIENYSDED